MGRRSSIEQLPEPLREELSRQLKAGRTIDELVAHLQQLGAQVSRSAMGRYVKSANESLETYRQGQEMARVWLDKLESDPQGDVGRLLPEMLRAVAFSTLSQMGEGGDKAKPVKPMEVMLLAKALKDLSGTQREAFAIERARREAREHARTELLAEQKAALAKAEKSKGVTADTRKAIHELLGIQ